MDWILWIIIIALAAFCFYMKFIEPKQKKAPAESKEIEREAPEKIDYSKSYQRKYLLTKNEYGQYKKLKEYADQAELLICPKVRLLDVLEPRKGEKNYKTLFYKVQAKHIDFLICDKDLHVLGAVELDDSSHDQKDRQERDTFVDQILESVGYKVVHTRYITEKTLLPFMSKLSKGIPRKNREPRALFFPLPASAEAED